MLTIFLNNKARKDKDMKLSLSTALLLVLWNHAEAEPEEGQLQTDFNFRPLDDTINVDQDAPIVGGQQSDPGEFPYYVDMWGCGGSLIAPRVVLGAAHCGSYRNYDVIVGGYEAGTTKHGAQRRNVVKDIMHPKYNSNSMVWDFSLYLLDEKVDMATSVKLDVNENKAKPAKGQQLTVLGLGALKSGGSSPDFLRDVKVNAVTTSYCNHKDRYDGEIKGYTMMCAAASGKDSCQGDSGGPIVIRDGDTHTQVGVVSWGYGCADPRYPGVYSRVSTAAPWIKEVVCNKWKQDADFCDTTDPNDPDDPDDGDCIDVVMDLKTDKFPKQTKLFLVTETGEKLWNKNRLSKKKTNHHFEACVKKSGCATLKVIDRKKNGLLKPGNLKVTADGKVKYNGRAYGAGKTFKFGDELSHVAPTVSLFGIHDPWLSHEDGLDLSDSKHHEVADDGLAAPLGGVWPEATQDRISPDVLQDPEMHLVTIHNSAANFFKRSRFNEALHLLDIIVKVQRKRNGPVHEDVGAALHNVGIANLRLGENYKALQAFEEAVRVRKGALGRDHPQVAVSLVKVGITLMLLKRLEDSLWMFREALTVRKHALGPLHPATARIFNNIGCVHVEFNEPKEAKRAFEAALDIQRSALVNEPESGPILFGAATTLQNMAYLYRSRQMHDQEAVVLRESLSILEGVLDSNHPACMTTLENLAHACAGASHEKHSLKYYNEYLERLHSQEGASPEQHASILFKMSKVHKQQNDLEAQLDKLHLATKQLQADETSPESRELVHKIQVDLRLARQELERKELDWV